MAEDTDTRTSTRYQRAARQAIPWIAAGIAVVFVAVPTLLYAVAIPAWRSQWNAVHPATAALVGNMNNGSFPCCDIVNCDRCATAAVNISICASMKSDGPCAGPATCCHETCDTCFDTCSQCCAGDCFTYGMCQYICNAHPCNCFCIQHTAAQACSAVCGTCYSPWYELTVLTPTPAPIVQAKVAFNVTGQCNRDDIGCVEAFFEGTNKGTVDDYMYRGQWFRGKAPAYSPPAALSSWAPALWVVCGFLVLFIFAGLILAYERLAPPNLPA